MEWLWKRCDTQEEKAQIHRSFWAFRHQKEEFYAASTCWVQLDNPNAFWLSFLGSDIHMKLASIALRIFNTPANSVASERAFSAMGLISSKLRNRLKEAKTGQLIYIHMNQRVLDKNTTLIDWQDGSEEEKVELEELLGGIEVDDEDDTEIIGESQELDVD
jgi:hypothetical protein